MKDSDRRFRMDGEANDAVVRLLGAPNREGPAPSFAKISRASTGRTAVDREGEGTDKNRAGPRQPSLRVVGPLL
jgi:hypothetical protein